MFQQTFKGGIVPEPLSPQKNTSLDKDVLKKITVKKVEENAPELLKQARSGNKMSDFSLNQIWQTHHKRNQSKEIPFTLTNCSPCPNLMISPNTERESELVELK